MKFSIRTLFTTMAMLTMAAMLTACFPPPHHHHHHRPPPPKYHKPPKYHRPPPPKPHRLPPRHHRSELINVQPIFAQIQYIQDFAQEGMMSNQVDMGLLLAENDAYATDAFMAYRAPQPPSYHDSSPSHRRYRKQPDQHRHSPEPGSQDSRESKREQLNEYRRQQHMQHQPPHHYSELGVTHIA